jgi:hypothetical protein
MPATETLHSHFGTYRQLYKAVGYQLPPHDWYHGEHAEPSIRLRRQLVKQLGEMFPKHVTVTSLSHSDRSILEVDHSYMVAVLLCKSYQRAGGRRFWVVRPTSAERQHITLLCKISPGTNRIASYHLLPSVDIPGRTRLSHSDDPSLCKGICLQKLAGFYAAVKALKCREAALV